MDNNTTVKSKNDLAYANKKIIIKLVVRFLFNIIEQMAMYATAVEYKYTFPDKRPSLNTFWVIKAVIILLFQIPVVLIYRIKPVNKKHFKTAYIIISMILTGIVVIYWLIYAHFFWYY
ncbi:MAG: hypothetical protein K6F27_11055 [Ruminococcus sp.]|nr:hypothetical protein [Ruminococcus sp.]